MSLLIEAGGARRNNQQIPCLVVLQVSTQVITDQTSALKKKPINKYALPRCHACISARLLLKGLQRVQIWIVENPTLPPGSASRAASRPQKPAKNLPKMYIFLDFF